MTRFFLDAHSIWQYVALFTVIFALVWTFRASVAASQKELVYRLTTIAVDIQVALGLVVWLSNSGWDRGLAQGWLHPIAGVAALGVLHAFVGRARREDPDDMDRTVRTGLFIAVVLVLAAIAIAEIV